MREGSCKCNGGWGDPPNTSWGQTHIGGLPIPSFRTFVQEVSEHGVVYGSKSVKVPTVGGFPLENPSDKAIASKIFHKGHLFVRVRFGWGSE